jgi:predicted deacylase
LYRIEKLAAFRRDIELKRHRLNHGTFEYDFYRIASRGIKLSDKLMLIRAGIHGDEVSGPLTILQYFNRIFDIAHHRGIKLIIYPLGNPAGFEAKTRYSGDNGREPSANNDFVRYEVEKGILKDDIRSGARFKRWYWSSDRRLNQELPPETGLMHALLKQEPLESIVAALDLHQDYITPIKRAAAYHYAFGDLPVYSRIVEAVDKIVPVAANRVISAGQKSGMRTNRQGFIVRHDGTLGDLMHRLGVSHSVTPETSGKTPLEAACRVNWTWIKGLINLTAKKRATVKRSYVKAIAAPLKKNLTRYRMMEIGRARTDAGLYPIYAAVTKNQSENLPGIILSAGIHGEEPAGVHAIMEFLKRGIVNYLNRFWFLILPCLNPYGFVRGVRFNHDGLDLNRKFDDLRELSELGSVKELLRKYPGPYRLALDFHETDTYTPKGADRSVENIPAGFYMYETTRTGHPELGPAIIEAVRRSGYSVVKRRSIYGARCRDGLILSTPPGSPGYPDLPEFNGSLDWYLLKNEYTTHFLTAETPTAWPLKRRVALHKKVLVHALKRIKNRK